MRDDSPDRIVDDHRVAAQSSQRAFELRRRPFGQRFQKRDRSPPIGDLAPGTPNFEASHFSADAVIFRNRPPHVEFAVDGGDRVRGWLFLPSKRPGRLPAVSLAHGYAGVEEHGLERFARAFAETGFVALVHDHRNFGASDGAVRHDIDPPDAVAALEHQFDEDERVIVVTISRSVGGEGQEAGRRGVAKGRI
jgi:hypothetical protein